MFRRRARSLAGPIPVYNFGPKAQLFKAEQNIRTVHDPGNTRLNWHTSPQSVLVVKKLDDPTVLSAFVQMLLCFLKKHMTIFVELNVLDEEPLVQNVEFRNIKQRLSTYTEGSAGLNEKIDFVVCLGGDGTLLYASSLFQTSVPPVLAFHLGSLGFLAPFQFTSLEQRIDCVLNNHANLTLRSRLKCEIRTSPQRSPGAISASPSVNGLEDGNTYVVLNDIVVDRAPSTNVDIFLDERKVTSLQGDGLVISTPTGSTAYAVAAGASIIHPGVPAIMLTPICPRSLSFRPVVVPAGCEVRITATETAREPLWVSFDGRKRRELRFGEHLRITTSVYPLPSICCTDQMLDWSDGLASCLHWNERQIQKPLTPLPY